MLRRQGLVAAVILLLLAIVGTTLYLRIDVASLEQQAMSDIIRTTGGRIKTESASFSLLHATLRLQGVSLESTTNDWAFSAGEIQVNLKLWPLLFGEARPNTVYLISPTLDLTGSAPLPGIAALAQAVPDLRAARLIVRQGAVTVAGLPYADQVEFDIRRTNHGDNLLVELRAAIGKGEIQLNGHAERDGKAPGRIFGKIEAYRLPIARLLGRPSPLPEYDKLKSALTFDISEKKAWQLFGDLSLHPIDTKAPTITLRGKLKGKEGTALAWKEGFIRIGDDATITTDGQCTDADGCTVHAKTEQLPLDAVGVAAGLKSAISGTAKASATLKWHDGIWLADAESSLNKLRWSGIDFPGLQVTWSGIRHEAGRTSIAATDIKQAERPGRIRLEGIEAGDDGWHFAAIADGVDGWWTGMANALLALENRKPEFRGSGILNARIEATHRQDGETASFEINGDQAEIGYDKQFTKPKDIPASISGNLVRDVEGDHLTIAAAQLAGAALRQLQWQRRGERQSLGIREANLDFSSLHSQGIHLPYGLDAWRGSLSGNLGNHTFRERQERTAWLEDLDATLQLQGLGMEGSGWSGLLQIRNGVARSSRVIWHGEGKQQAVASGRLNLTTRKGTLNLNGVDLDWPQSKALPAWFESASIRGHIRADRFTWAGNAWEGIKTNYRLQGNRITLKRLSATLGGGSIGSDRLALTLRPDAVHFAGAVRMGLVQLQKIDGLDAIMGAPPRGYLYLNANLEGEIPFAGLATWKGAGDIEIQRGGWHGGNFTLALPDHTSGKREAYRFSRASSHFRIAPDGIDLSDLQLEAGNTISDGSAHIGADGALSGDIRIKDEHGITNGRLQGLWPHVEVNRP